MGTTILKVNISELTPQFIEDLKGDLGQDAQVEIRVQESKHGQGLFSENGFWEIIDLLDWSQRDRSAVIAPAAKALSQMHLPAIFLFQDILSEKFFISIPGVMPRLTNKNRLMAPSLSTIFYTPGVLLSLKAKITMRRY